MSEEDWAEERRRRRAAATSYGPREVPVDPLSASVQAAAVLREIVALDEVSTRITLNACRSYEEMMAQPLSLIEIICDSGISLMPAEIDFLEDAATLTNLTPKQVIWLKNIYDRAVRHVHHRIG